MDMLDVSVTLIVKAPNQQIEDQTIKCDTTWSIRKLKGYLAEVYPSKPRTEDQKLIYSGQLLPDTVILKDVLRKYDGQDTHTVHLVCSTSRDALKRSVPNTSRPSSRTSEADSIPDLATAVPDTDASRSAMNENPSAPGLRQRLSGASVPTATYQYSTSGPGYPATDPRGVWASMMAQPYPGGYDPNHMTQQLMYMQQAYAQYMTHYMQMMAANAGQNPMSPSSVPSPPRPATPEQSPVNNVREQPDPQPEDNPNIPDGEEDEGRGNRDWLDWFYIMSRVMVLFSIVYFYSSPTRFIIVSALGVLMYLYQVGYFRVQQIQAARVEADNNNHLAGAGAADNHNLRNNQDEDDSTDDPSEEPTEPEPADEAREPIVLEERPPLLALTWTFFSTFFASLIPEQPGV